MTNFKRYTMVIRRDENGFATPALKVRQKGEVLKFNEVEGLLNSSATEIDKIIDELLVIEKYKNAPVSEVLDILTVSINRLNELKKLFA